MAEKYLDLYHDASDFTILIWEPEEFGFRIELNLRGDIVGGPFSKEEAKEIIKFIQSHLNEK